MSEKRSHSSLSINSSSPSVDNFQPEPQKKRWKSSELEDLFNSTDSRSIQITNGSDSTSTTSSMDSENGIKTVTVIPTNNDHKQIRYDRQLRLWGDHGQNLLESAHVCLLNATAIGTEILKSLILPGVGAFTIIDGEIISGSDIGSNFFLESTSIGQKRAKVACELLQELNSDVKASYLELSPEHVISQRGSAIFDQFTVVIGTNLKRQTALILGEYLFKRGIPFLTSYSCGLVGYVRLWINEHPVIESHPDNPLPNFMLDRPFPELIRFINSMDLDSMDHKQHCHTPYVVLLFKALEIWRRDKNEGDARFPRVHKEKLEVKKILKAMRKPDEKGWLDEENFQEAMNSVNAALSETVVPASVDQILNDNAAITLTTYSSNFWILCHGLRRFVNEHGRLPVRGSLPDMISDSERYIQLQNVYLHKAEDDASIVQSYAMEAAQRFGKIVDILETRQFCKNAGFLRLIRGSAPSEDDGMKNPDFIDAIKNEDLNALWFVALRACEEFYTEHDRYPCSKLVDVDENANLEADKRELLNRMDGKLSELMGQKENAAKLNDVVNEICRYGGSELHTVASFLGGVAAQEVIKFVTRQYVPLDNTYVFDANTGQASIFSFHQ